MIWINRFKALVIISLSTIISFFIVEYSYRYIVNDPNPYNTRTMLFETGENFKILMVISNIFLAKKFAQLLYTQKQSLHLLMI